MGFLSKASAGAPMAEYADRKSVAGFGNESGNKAVLSIAVFYL